MAEQPTFEELAAILTDPDVLAGKYLSPEEQEEHRRCTQSIVEARRYAEAHAHEHYIGASVRMHRWQRDGSGHRCEVCGSTVGVNPGLDSYVFPCPGQRPLRGRSTSTDVAESEATDE